MKFIHVKWRDIISLSGWKHTNTVKEWAAEDDGGSHHESAGWLFGQSGDFIILIPHNQLDGPHVGDPMRIPKSVILEVRQAPPPEKWRKIRL